MSDEKEYAHVQIHMKSGKTINVFCEGCSVEMLGGEVSSYRFDNTIASTLLAVRISAIEAIVQVDAGISKEDAIDKADSLLHKAMGN